MKRFLLLFTIPVLLAGIFSSPTQAWTVNPPSCGYDSWDYRAAWVANGQDIALLDSRLRSNFVYVTSGNTLVIVAAKTDTTRITFALTSGQNYFVLGSNNYIAMSFIPSTKAYVGTSNPYSSANVTTVSCIQWANNANYNSGYTGSYYPEWKPVEQPVETVKEILVERITPRMSAGDKIGITLAFLLGWFIIYFGYKAYSKRGRR